MLSTGRLRIPILLMILGVEARLNHIIALQRLAG